MGGVTTVTAGTQRVSVSTKEVVDVSLGILSETRKQTLLMEASHTDRDEVTPEVDRAEAIDSPSVEVIGDGCRSNGRCRQIDSPQVAVESPQMEVISEMPQAAIEQTPIFDTPELAMQMPPIESPSVEIESPSGAGR